MNHFKTYKPATHVTLKPTFRSTHTVPFWHPRETLPRGGATFGKPGSQRRALPSNIMAVNSKRMATSAKGLSTSEVQVILVHSKVRNKMGFWAFLKGLGPLFYMR